MGYFFVAFYDFMVLVEYILVSMIMGFCFSRVVVLEDRLAHTGSFFIEPFIRSAVPLPLSKIFSKR